MSWSIIHGDFRKQKPPTPKPGQKVIFVGDFPYSTKVHLGRRTGSSAGGYGGKSKSSNAGRGGVVSEIEYDPITKELIRAAMKWIKMMHPEWVCFFADDETAQWWKDALRKTGLYTFGTNPWVKPDSAARKAGEGPDSDVEWLVDADGGELPSPTLLRRLAGEIERGFDIPDHDRVLIARHMKRIRRYGNRDGHFIEPTASTRGKPGSKMQGEKPIGLIRKVLQRYAEPGDLVIDLTCGTGTTGVAAIEYGCDFWGCEIRESIWRIARKRLAAADAQIVMPIIQSYVKPRQLDAVKTGALALEKA